MGYDPEEIRRLYERDAGAEWNRFDSPLGRVQLEQIHRFLARYIPPGSKVLDAGSGPGRFALALAEAGCELTLVDLSERLLSEAEARFREARLLSRIAGIHRGDIVDLSFLPDGSFDVVLCLGGALSYVREQVEAALQELMRVCKPGGLILGSVMSRLSALRTGLVYGWDPVADGHPQALKAFLETGDFPPGETTLTDQPAHFFRSKELVHILSQTGLDVLEMRGTNALLTLPAERLVVLQSDREVWAALEDAESEACLSAPELGSHILFAGRRGEKDM